MKDCGGHLLVSHADFQAFWLCLGSPIPIMARFLGIPVPEPFQGIGADGPTGRHLTFNFVYSTNLVTTCPCAFSFQTIGVVSYLPLHHLCWERRSRECDYSSPQSWTQAIRDSSHLPWNEYSPDHFHDGSHFQGHREQCVVDTI